jgi:hypothetical protein
MSKKFQISKIARGILCLAAVFCIATAAATAQAPAPQAQPGTQSPSGPQGKPDAQTPGKAKTGTANGEKHITPDEAKELFGLVDQLLKFSSQETGLPIKSDVKRRMTTREEVEKYLLEKLNDDEDAKRMQRSEIVLKKFGLLDRDFNLKPFLLALLKEQIEAYYDPKTKTVNMLDWIAVDEQKPVLAHELTHALQDQHLDLDKWSDQTPPDVSHTAPEDKDHLAKDELDTAREAVTEGQATAVMFDQLLKPMGKSLIGDPEIVETIKQDMAGSENSPVLARAPLLLSESLLFPYREGLSFEQDLWMDRGQAAAFTGALDRPPSSSWEIMNPREYEKGHVSKIPYLPDIHPLLDSTYRPYDIGQVGQLDLHILTGLFGGDRAASDLTPAWDGGIYWAGQKLSATTPEQLASTKSISLFYLSIWKNEASAQAFAHLYSDELGRQYSGIKLDKATSSGSGESDGTVQQVYNSDEGPLVITRQGKMVFVSESFDLPMARKLAAFILGSQGALQSASASRPGTMRASPELAAGDLAPEALTEPMVHFLSNCGVMKAAVDAAVDATLRASYPREQVPLGQR